MGHSNRPHLRSSPTDVYRVYDARGDLLYVGISSRLIFRLAEHRRWSGWFDSAVTIAVEEYSDQRKARRAEALAIRDESPIHNVRAEAINARALPPGEPPEWTDFYVVDVVDIWGDPDAS